MRRPGMTRPSSDPSIVFVVLIVLLILTGHLELMLERLLEELRLPPDRPALEGHISFSFELQLDHVLLDRDRHVLDLLLMLAVESIGDPKDRRQPRDQCAIVFFERRELLVLLARRRLPV